MSALIQHTVNEDGPPRVRATDCMDRAGGEPFVALHIEAGAVQTMLTHTDPAGLADWLEAEARMAVRKLRRIVDARPVGVGS